mmetsp:Transcript_18453/g.32743  ORF Transcript_18453/g.32743 Transcript_18453/m.32743 type:complete len:97 (+) Transcript_18453:131-421(+)
MGRGIADALDQKAQRRINLQMACMRNAAAVLDLCQREKLSGFDAINVATALHRIAKLAEGGRNATLKDSAESLLARAARAAQSGEFQAQALANTAW